MTDGQSEHIKPPLRMYDLELDLFEEGVIK